MTQYQAIDNNEWMGREREGVHGLNVRTVTINPIPIPQVLVTKPKKKKRKI